MAKICFAVIALAATAVLAAYNNKYAGPFDVVIVQFADCSNPGKYPSKLVGNKISKVNRTLYVYSGVLRLHSEMNDEVQATSRAAVFGNGGWKADYFVSDWGGVCSAISNYLPVIFQQFKQETGVDGCPIPPGNYTLKNFLVKMDVNWPAMPYNRYRFDFYLKKHGKDYACKKFFLNIIPKTGT